MRMAARLRGAVKYRGNSMRQNGDRRPNTDGGAASPGRPPPPRPNPPPPERKPLHFPGNTAGARMDTVINRRAIRLDIRSSRGPRPTGIRGKRGTLPPFPGIYGRKFRNARRTPREARRKIYNPPNPARGSHCPRNYTAARRISRRGPDSPPINPTLHSAWIADYL